MKVLVNFLDGQDGDKHYVKGEEYPRGNYKPSKERLKELSDKGLIEILKQKSTKKES